MSHATAERVLVVARVARLVGVLWAVLTVALPVEAQREVPVASRWPPPPLDMRVPFEPTAFPSAGRVHVTYEVHLRNFAPTSVTLQRVEILDADTAGARRSPLSKAMRSRASCGPSACSRVRARPVNGDNWRAAEASCCSCRSRSIKAHAFRRRCGTASPRATTRQRAPPLARTTPSSDCSDRRCEEPIGSWAQARVTTRTTDADSWCSMVVR